MGNTGYTIKVTDSGYIVERFSMNSQTFDVYIHDTRGPFKSRQAAEKEESKMRKERDAQ